MATAIYLRQSRDRDGNELAVSRQREDCEKLCADRGWTDTVEYVDNNVSASNRTKVRPGYRRMLADIAAGRIDGVVVWDCDRLYRQPRELEDFIDLADERHLRLATVTGDVDLATDNGRLFARIKGAVAKAEGERKAARWKRSNEQGAAAGKWTATHRPFGYTLDGKPRGREATLLRQAYADVLEGKSLRRIAVEWNEKAVPTVRGAAWTNNRIRRMLLNPRYAALRVLRGEVVGDGAWEPIVAREIWDGVASRLRDEGRRICTTFEVAHQGAGVYRCGHTDSDGNPDCGEAMKTHYDGRGVRGYSCSGQQHLSRRGATLDDYVAAWILERLLTEPDVWARLDERDEVNVPELEREREALVSRRKDLARLLADGALDADAVAAQSKRLSKQIDGINDKLAETARVASPAEALVAAAAAGEDQLYRCWQGMSAALRGQAIDVLVSVVVLPCPLGLRRFDPAYVRVSWRKEVDA
jgi:site-specific DNA recombinase